MARPRSIHLSAAEERALEHLAMTAVQSRRARRARIVLLLARGWTTGQICAEVGCTAQTVKAWRNRYQSGGLDSLRRPLQHH